MKSSSHKPSYSRKRSRQPFFHKNNKNGTSKTEESFFSPAPFIQHKLTVGQPGDKFEQQADAVADRVVNNAAPAQVQAAVENNATLLQSKEEQPSVQKAAEEKKKEEKPMLQKAEEKKKEDKPMLQKAEEKKKEEKPALQKTEEKKKEEKPVVQKSEEKKKEEKPGLQKAEEKKKEEKPAVQKTEERKDIQAMAEGTTSTPKPSMQQQLSNKNGRGSRMPSKTEVEMSAAFGRDLSQVNIHTDAESMDMARDIHAHAFTNGMDIYFNEGKFNPETQEGKHLLAHELTHVVQQNGEEKIQRQAAPGTKAAPSVTLQGDTRAKFKYSNTAQKTKEVAATGCENCTGNCVHATGIIVISYSVATTVTLPRLADFPDLTTCQRRKMQNAITNILSPHEQKHVKAFRTYNGKVKIPYDFVCCSEDVNAKRQEIADQDAAQREADAQALSDALDPFEVEVDLDCE